MLRVRPIVHPGPMEKTKQEMNNK